MPGSSERTISHGVLPATPQSAVRGRPRPVRPPDKSSGGAGGRLFLVVLLAIPVAATALWFPYYLSPAAERVRDSMHPLLRPSGVIGQAFGIFGLALFLFMWLYPLRKKLGLVRWIGSIGAWLRVHTYIGLALPLLIAVHAGWRFHGLIGLGYLAMVIVAASGIVGRYLYTRIPRSRSGAELSREEIGNRRRALVTGIAADLGLLPEEVEASLERVVDPSGVAGVGGTLLRLFSDDVARWRAVSALRREWATPRNGARPVEPKVLNAAVKLARDEIRLAQQIRVLDATQRVFRYWHVAHRPVSVTAFLAIGVHVAVAILMGQTWLH
ncbi:MAG TPA: hypothetical protein VF363_07910 [Candidatus Eisenbacteria bacterium]